MPVMVFSHVLMFKKLTPQDDIFSRIAGSSTQCNENTHKRFKA